MSVTHETPGPKVGFILNALLEEALLDPDLNQEDYLETRAIALAKLDEKELKTLADKGKDKQKEVERGELKKIRDKYRVK